VPSPFPSATAPEKFQTVTAALAAPAKLITPASAALAKSIFIRICKPP
jgi:hypothetical protein